MTQPIGVSGSIKPTSKTNWSLRRRLSAMLASAFGVLMFGIIIASLTIFSPLQYPASVVGAEGQCKWASKESAYGSKRLVHLQLGINLIEDNPRCYISSDNIDKIQEWYKQHGLQIVPLENTEQVSDIVPNVCKLTVRTYSAVNPQNRMAGKEAILSCYFAVWRGIIVSTGQIRKVTLLQGNNLTGIWLRNHLWFNVDWSEKG
jgi:hypothetical protein